MFLASSFWPDVEVLDRGVLQRLHVRAHVPAPAPAPAPALELALASAPGPAPAPQPARAPASALAPAPQCSPSRFDFAPAHFVAAP